MDSEAVYITKKLLFAVLIVFSIAIFCSSNLYATNETQTANGTNLSLEQITNETSDSQNLENNNTLSTSNSNDTNTINHTETSQTAAGDASSSDIHGVWLTANDALKLNATDINNLIKTGITDIFVKTNRITDPTYESVLPTLLALVNGTGINVHAWITCFKDANGNWIDPQGKTSYEVQVPYTEAVTLSYQQRYKGYYYKAYTVKVKKWYKSGKRWKYYYTYVTKYKRVYGWTYRTVYYTGYVTKYRTETRYTYDTTYNTRLIDFIKNITSTYNIQGIHLDYVRYSGVGDNAAYKNPGGTEAITSFVQQVYEAVNAIKPDVKVSAALMPEGSENAKYYGQNYTQLSQYLDFLVPMIYKGNYNKGTAWIASTTKYIVEHSNGKPVVAGLLTYVSDDNVTRLSAAELQNDINTAISSGSSGYVLFRYGLINSSFNGTSTVSSEAYPITFALSELEDAASRVKAFIETNHRLPAYVEISGTAVNMPEFLQMLIKSIININDGTTTPVSLKNIEDPTDSTVTDSIYGNILLSEYMEIAQRINSYINSENKAPNFETSSLGNVGYKSIIYMYSKILNFYRLNSALPNYVTMDSFITNPESNPVPSDLLIHLQATTNCQVNDPAIQSLAASITAGATSQYEKAVRIFNWVRDNIGYSFYYNTKYGAVGTLNARTGNCVDTTHLLVALERAAGIPAIYEHGYCQFSSGSWYGHVWAQVWVNNEWFRLDATSSRNTFGVINNWNLYTARIYNVYGTLPF